jgi:hypothetical protein
MAGLWMALPSRDDIGAFEQLHSSLQLISQNGCLVLANLRLMFDV